MSQVTIIQNWIIITILGIFLLFGFITLVVFALQNYFKRNKVDYNYHPIEKSDGMTINNNLFYNDSALINQNKTPFQISSTILDRLSSRQKEVAELWAKGYSSKKIGETLFISKETVNQHIKAIYRVLELKEVDKKSEFIIKCYQNNWFNIREIYKS